MALITFMSDFGEADHYVAAVKARILNINPGQQIVDISHQVDPFDIAHGAYILQSVYKEFPEGTIHLAAVNTLDHERIKYLVMKMDGHIFIGADNGLLSLVCGKEPEYVGELMDFGEGITVFPTTHIMARAAAMIAQGTNINEISKKWDDYRRLLKRQFKATKKQIAGNVIRIDHFGNLITNIEEEIYNILSKGRVFELKFGKEVLFKIHASYASVEPGEIFAVFNSGGLLEIGINKGNAHELLGLGYDSTVSILFMGDE